MYALSLQRPSSARINFYSRKRVNTPPLEAEYQPGLAPGFIPLIHERFNQSWAEKMILLLCKINDSVKVAKLEGKTALEAAIILGFETEFQTIIDTGYESNPEILNPDAVKTKGRPKRAKALNLISRLDLQRKQAMGFMHDFAVPFDNNLAERDIRMTKLKLKISGAFRSELGAHAFAQIRGYISTLKKQGLNVLEALTKAFFGNPRFV